jgi:hypothetical protein
MEHKNSRKITIFRAGSFLSRSQKGMDDYFADTKQSIGSYWEGGGSQRIASGLSFEEIRILLPFVTEVDSTHPEFMKKVNEFYRDISTNVPYNTGVTLETGLCVANNKEVSIDRDNPEKSNLPINLSDYLKFRQLKGHPRVAKNKEEADGNATMEFYIFDKYELQSKNTKKMEEKDAAMRIYLEIKDDEIKPKMLLTLMGVDPRKFTGPNEKTLITEELRKLSESKPTYFVEVFNNSHLDTDYWLQSLVNAGVLKKIGDKYIDAENDKIVGNSQEETRYYFEDEVNSDLVTTWKARYQEKQYSPKNK